jgi:hypothetical protein
MTTRSTLLGRGQVPAGAYADLYSVPAGWVTILKSIDYSTAGALDATLVVQLFASDSSMALTVVNASTMTNGMGSWAGWVMLNPGDLIRATAGVGPMDVWISGTELPAPPATAGTLPTGLG